MNAYRLPVLEISAIPEVAIGSMNETHREEVELVNELGALLDQGLKGEVAEPEITAKLNQWVDHTRQHFDSENQLMEEYGFPALPIHRDEHSRMMAIIESLREQWLADRLVEPLAEFIFRKWPEWFDIHVNSMDRVTAQFISQRLSG
ncbi:MAG: hypothetical protein EP315_08225 [Gammaproteobacteria bacterium]|nr:MAG: hypothetical protein EP315_08225 [Gammaproteobacteria bacterium]